MNNPYHNRLSLSYICEPKMLKNIINNSYIYDELKCKYEVKNKNNPKNKN